jgi:tellurite resistance protein TerC
MTATLTQWVVFNFAILIILTIDLVRFYQKPHRIAMKEALLASIFWIALALLFNGWIYWQFGFDDALNFLTGYLLEKSLSVDNLFVFLLIFSHFKVPEISKHQVLFYGVLGAILLRALLIYGGVTLVHWFHWIFALFGAFLIYSGFKLAYKKESEAEIEDSYLFIWLKKRIAFTDKYDEKGSFFIEENGKWLATPLVAVIFLIELTDLVFALDSVPAILGITTNAFIVYTSNIFAILGLRSLFFALEGMIEKFWLLHYALAFILIFIGFKMLFESYLEIPTSITLLVIISALIAAIISSLNFQSPKHK